MQIALNDILLLSADKLENSFLFLFWQVLNILYKTRNKLWAVLYNYMKEHKIAVLTFQSKQTQSCSSLETKQQATALVTNVAAGF